MDFWPASAGRPRQRGWATSIAGYRRDRRALVRLVSNPRRDLSARLPAGNGQTYFREIVLVADHTAYHVGQLIAVRRLLGCWPAG